MNLLLWTGHVGEEHVNRAIDCFEVLGKALPELAAATRIWRDFFTSPEEGYTEGIIT